MDDHPADQDPGATVKDALKGALGVSMAILLLSGLGLWIVNANPLGSNIIQ